MVSDITGDVRELIVQTQTLPPYHADSVRNAVTLAQCYAIDDELTDPEPTTVAVFDDILATGTHFRAMKRVLLQRFPDVHVVGIFIARRAPWSGEI